MSLPLHQLEGFYYTGLTGGYARAAAAMPFPITEPAVYQQVRKLERGLGGREENNLFSTSDYESATRDLALHESATSLRALRSGSRSSPR